MSTRYDPLSLNDNVSMYILKVTTVPSAHQLQYLVLLEQTPHYIIYPA